MVADSLASGELHRLPGSGQDVGITDDIPEIHGLQSCCCCSSGLTEAIAGLMQAATETYRGVEFQVHISAET